MITPLRESRFGTGILWFAFAMTVGTTLGLVFWGRPLAEAVVASLVPAIGFGLGAVVFYEYLGKDESEART